MNKKKVKVMVFEDDSVFLDELSASLQLDGYDVVPVTDGRYALDVAKRSMPDVILTDLRMKRISGFEIANILSHSDRTKNIPIIAITGVFIRKEDEEIIKAGGIRKCLKKPVDPETVKMEIEKALKEGSAAAGKGP